MRSKICLIVKVLGLATVLSLPACATSQRTDNTAMLPEDQRESAVPWTRPEKWESTSKLGPLANDPRFSGGGTGTR